MTRVAVVMVGLLAGAGCLGSPAPTVPDVLVEATSAWFSLGYASDGNGAVPFEGGRIAIQANPATNTGLAQAEGSAGDHAWSIHFDRFAQQGNRSFQDGGIATDVAEHGASGNGDASIPQVHATLAAWGEANVTVDGVPLNDTVTGNHEWVAHYMVLSTGVRDDATRAMHADQAKSTVYDPARPDQGWADPADAEVHLVLRTHQPPPTDPIPVDVAGDVTSPEYDHLHDLFGNAQLGGHANLMLTVETDTAVPLARYDFTFELFNPEGDSVREANLASEASADPMSVPFDFPLNRLGNYTLHVTGSGVNAKYRLHGELVPPAEVVLNFWFEDVHLGGRQA